jgi:hypothetical protein
MNTTSSNGAYDPETVALLSRVLDESFMTLMNATPVLDPEWRQGVRHRLAQVIIGAFHRGERDPEVLKRTAIQIVASTYQPTPDIE